MEISTSDCPLLLFPIKYLILSYFILSYVGVTHCGSINCCDTSLVSHMFQVKPSVKRLRKHQKRFFSPETPIPTGVSGERNDSLAVGQRELARRTKRVSERKMGETSTVCETNLSFTQNAQFHRRKPTIGETLKAVLEKILSITCSNDY